jgi:GNAT superfamily N-acetyltransferase
VATEIRPAAADDAPAIGRVRRESWFAAYAGIIDAELIDHATAAWATGVEPPPYRSTLVAVAPEERAAGGGAVASARAVVGYAAFGPERTVASAFPPGRIVDGGAGQSAGVPAGGSAGSAGGSAGSAGGSAGSAGGSAAVGLPPFGPITPAGLAGEAGEVYAIYLAPAWWSAGIGRALMDAALAELRAGGYRRVVLWTLTGNARARRFYDRAGFAPDGATNILSGLGGAEELRYVRDL